MEESLKFLKEFLDSPWNATTVRFYRIGKGFKLIVRDVSLEPKGGVNERYRDLSPAAI